MPISQEYPELVASIQFLWAEELKANPLAKPIEFLLKHLKRRHGALTLFKKFRNDCPAEAGCCALCTFMWEDFLLNWMYHAERSLVVRITTITPPPLSLSPPPPPPPPQLPPPPPLPPTPTTTPTTTPIPTPPSPPALSSTAMLLRRGSMRWNSNLAVSRSNLAWSSSNHDHSSTCVTTTPSPHFTLTPLPIISLLVFPKLAGARAWE